MKNHHTTTRTYEALRRVGLDPEDTIYLTDEFLLTIPNIGKTSLSQLRQQHPYFTTAVTTPQLLEIIEQAVTELRKRINASHKQTTQQSKKLNAQASQIQALTEMYQRHEQ